MKKLSLTKPNTVICCAICFLLVFSCVWSQTRAFERSGSPRQAVAGIRKRFPGEIADSQQASSASYEIFSRRQKYASRNDCLKDMTETRLSEGVQLFLGTQNVTVEFKNGLCEVSVPSYTVTPQEWDAIVNIIYSSVREQYQINDREQIHLKTNT